MKLRQGTLPPPAIMGHIVLHLILKLQRCAALIKQDLGRGGADEGELMQLMSVWKCRRRICGC